MTELDEPRLFTAPETGWYHFSSTEGLVAHPSGCGEETAEGYMACTCGALQPSPTIREERP